MTAREYFESARSAQRHIDGRLAAIQAMRAREGVRAQGYEAIGRSSGVSDPMRGTDARMDAEASAREELAAYEREVAAARAVCRGMTRANPHLVWGELIELHYIELMSWAEVATALSMSPSTARSQASAALDWVERHGVAAVREWPASADAA